MNSIKMTKSTKSTKVTKSTSAQNEFFKNSINDISKETNILFVFLILCIVAVLLVGLKLFLIQKNIADFNTSIPFLERSVGLLAEDSQKMKNQLEELNSTVAIQTKQMKTLQLKLKKTQDRVDSQDKQIELLRNTIYKNEK